MSVEMHFGPKARERAARFAEVAALPLILLAPFVAFIQYHDYGLWRPETLLCAAILVALGLALGGLTVVRPSILRPLVVALLITHFIDTQIDWRGATGLFAVTGSLWGVPVMSLKLVLGVPLTVVTLMALTWVLREHLAIIVTVTFGVITLALVALPGETVRVGEIRNLAAPPSHDLPPMVHLVLDEQIGVEGVPTDIAGGTELRRDLTAFYQRFGFALFARAYTRFDHTAESLSNLLNGAAMARPGAYLASLNPLVLRNNAWFRVLSGRGYRIRVYQSSFLDFCDADGANVDYCYVYNMWSIQALRHADIGLGGKVRAIMSTFFRKSLFYRMLRRVYNERLRITLAEHGIAIPGWDWERSSASTLASLEALDRLTADLAAAPRGTAIFAHLLLPHAPYLYQRDCRLNPRPADWLDATHPSQPAPYLNSPATRERRYELYFEQVRCAHRKLGRLLENLRDAGVLETATVIVHGDHGSRIVRVTPTAENARRASDTDYIDSFSTLFAIRSPELEQRYDRGLRSIQDLFATIVLGRPMTEERPQIFLSTAQRVAGKPLTPRDMISFGE